MYDPVWNSVLVQIDDKDAKWGKGNDESMLGASFSKGKVIRIGNFHGTDSHPISTRLMKDVNSLKGKQIIWNEGAEAGTTFEFDGQLFGFVYWHDIRGVLVNPQ